ncbi:MAG: MMPL family transporter [Bacteroidales bacterium]
MNTLAESIIKFKWLIILFVLSLTVFFGYQISNLHINADIISSLPDDDPAAKLYKDIGKEFNGNNMGMIVLQTDDVFSADAIKHIQLITDSIKYSHGVSIVTSLTNILDIRDSEWGIEIGKLVDEYDLPVEQTALDNLKEYVFSKEMYKNIIVSDDGTATAIIFTLSPDVNNQDIAKEIRKKVEGMNLPEKLYFGGFPMMMNDANDVIVADILWLIPSIIVIISLILLFSFKSVKGVIFPLLTSGLSVIWTLGIMSVAGYELTIISNIIPVILLAVGSAYSIHVLNSINNTLHKDRQQAIIKAVAYISIPVILSAITTAMGFASFILGAYLLLIKDFGLFTAIGTLIALILSLFFMPAVISAFSMHSKNIIKTNTDSRTVFYHKIFNSLIGAIIKHPKYILFSWLLILMIFIVGISRIETSVNIVEYFKKDNPTRLAEDILQEKFGGSSPIFVIFKGDMQSPEVLQMMMKTQQFMETNPFVFVTQSVADLIEQMNDVMGEGKKIPDDKAKIEQLWFLLQGQDVMPQLVNDDLTKGIIQSKFASVNTKDIELFTHEMNHFIEENNNEHCEIELTGIPSVYANLNSSLINSQYSSLLLAIVIVIVFVGTILKSILKGVYAAIPVIATIIVLFGFMGLSGIHLDIATVLVSSIALGIGIDYSIHIITGFNNYMIENGDTEKSIEKVILSRGKAISTNVFSVSAGFLVLLFSQLVPLQHFGLLLAIAMLVSGIGSLTLLPAILILVNRKRQITKKNHNV